MRILILEDNEERRRLMGGYLAERFSQYTIQFFDAVVPLLEAIETDGLEDVIMIALDHDLELLPGPDGTSIDPGTGVDAARSIARRIPACPVVIHTTNQIGGDQMQELLEEGGWSISRVVPYGGAEWIGEVWTRAVRNAIVGSVRPRSSLSTRTS